MEAYLDLSLIVFVVNFIISFVYSLIIFDRVKYKFHFIFISVVLSTIFGIINVLFVPYLLILGMVLYALIMGIFDLKYLKVIIMTLLLYYFNDALLLLIGGCFLYEGILLISTPFVTFFIFLEPIYITILHLLFSMIFKYLKYKNFKVKCSISLDNKEFKGKGFYDSGNSLIYNELPVIFIKGNPISNNGEIIRIKGINDYAFSYLAYDGILKIKNKTIKVYAVFVGKNMDFNNCEFLLNKFVM